MKRRSATSSARQREELVFFIDHSLGAKAVAEALRRAGARVEVLKDHFPEDTQDQVWIEVARRGWVLLTKDAAIRKRPLEVAAVRSAKARVFVLTARNMRGEEMAQVFVKHLKRIESLARSRRPPFWARVSRDGVKLEKL